MSIIAKLLTKIYGPTEERLLMIGLDASGRTTALYKLKLGGVVTTIPTIGFNVETVEYKNMAFTMWDVGGGDKIRPLWRHYYQNTQGVLFFIDASDRERLEETYDELQRLLAEDELRDAKVCILVNKQDLPNALTVDEVQERVQKIEALTRRPYLVQGTCATTGDGLYEVLDWMVQANKNRGTRQEKATVEQGSTIKESGAESQGSKAQQDGAAAAGEESGEKKEVLDAMERTLLEWLEREETDEEELLAQLDDFTLDSWDHYTHLRIAWVLLRRHGRRDGLKLIFAKIKSFISNSTRTQRSRGTTFHETMTYFWCHMVHYAMELTPNPDNTFRTFLLLNPRLANGGLFLEFYSKKLMLMTASSREEVALPDIKQLPSLLSNMDQLKKDKPQPHGQGGVVGEAASDEQFLNDFHQGTLKAWGHEAKIRVIWTILHENDRRKGVGIILSGMKEKEGKGYNMTLTYFWIQMVSLAIAKGQKQNLEVVKFEDFKNMKEVQKLLANPQLFAQHYSDDVLFADDAAEAFVVPDKKPLPNVV